MTVRWCLVPCLAALAGCDRDALDGIVCPAIFIPAVSVSVLDSVSTANVTPGSTMVLRNESGLVTDSASVPNIENPVLTEYVLGGGTGTYSLTVRRNGYKPWIRSGIVVQQQACGPRTVRDTARLQPAD